MNVAQTERTKLTANFMNAITSGTVLASLVAPFVGFGLGTMPMEDTWNLIGLSPFGLVLAVVPHLLARRVLSNLED